MKNIFLSCFILANLVCINVCTAQLGWQWGVGGRNAGLDVTQIVSDNAGNVYSGAVSLATEPFATFGTDTVFNITGGQQMIITKTDSSGHFVWVKGSQNGDVFISSMATDLWDNLYVVGNYTGAFTLDTFHFSDTTLNYGMFVAKISTNGTVLWGKTIVRDGNLPDGIVGVDNAGNVYIHGYYLSATLTMGTTTLHNADAPDGDIFLAKFDANGNPIWLKGTPNVGYETAISMSVNWNGDAFISGTFYTDTLNIGGTYIYGDSSNFNDSNSDGNNYFAKYDSSGNVIWAQYLSYRLLISSSALDAGENIYLTGAADSALTLDTVALGNAGGGDIFVAKFDSAGSLQWAKTAGGALDEYAFSISVDNCGKLWISGRPGATSAAGYPVYFGTDTLTFSWDTSVCGDPMLLAEYDDMGNYITSLKEPSGGDDYNGVVVDNKGNFFVGGDYYYVGAPMTFGPDTLGNVNILEALFVGKYKYSKNVCDCSGSPVFASFTSTGTGTVSFTYTGSTIYDSLVWHFGDGTTSTGPDPVHTYTAPGIYTVCIYLYSTCLPLDKPYLVACNTIDIPNGVANINKLSEIEVYPNPAAATLNIHAVGEPIMQINISNVMGQVVCSKSTTPRPLLKTGGEMMSVDVSGLVPGVYFVKVNDVVRKFVKE